MITTPMRKTELASSIFTWCIRSFPCSLLPIDWCRISFNKNGFAKALFRGSFPSSSQACCCADAWEEMVRPWTVWKKKPSRSCWSDRWRDADIFCWICVLFGFLRWLKDQVSHHHQASRKPDGSRDPQAYEDNWFCYFSHLSKNLTVVTLVTFGLGWIRFGIVLSTARISNSQGYGTMDVFMCCNPETGCIPTWPGAGFLLYDLREWKVQSPLRQTCCLTGFLLKRNPKLLDLL